MYSNIVNPETNRVVYVSSKLGKKIIRKYLFVLNGGAGGGAADSYPIETTDLKIFTEGSIEDIERAGGLGMIVAHGSIIPDEYIIIPEGVNIITITHRGDVLSVDPSDDIGSAQIVVDHGSRLMLLQDKLSDDTSTFYKSGNIIPNQILSFRMVFPGDAPDRDEWSYGGIWKWKNPSQKIASIPGSHIKSNGFGMIADISKAGGKELKDYVLSNNDQTIINNDDLWVNNYRLSDILREIVNAGKLGTYILFSCRSQRSVVTPSDTCNRIMVSLDNKITALQSEETERRKRKTLEKVLIRKSSAPLLRRLPSAEPEYIPESLPLIQKYYDFVNHIYNIRDNIAEINYVFTTPAVKYVLKKNKTNLLKNFISIESGKTTIIGLKNATTLNGTVHKLGENPKVFDRGGNLSLVVIVEDIGPKRIKVDNLIISPNKYKQTQIIKLLTYHCISKYKNIQPFSAKEICIYLDLFQNKINLDAWQLCTLGHFV